MVKILTISLSMFLFKPIIIPMMISSVLMMLLYMFTPMNMSSNIINNNMYYDNMSTLLIFLTILAFILIMITSNNTKKISLTMTPIFIILIMTFMMNNPINFYILFELVLIPTMILITSLGNQPERLQAGIYLVMYTVLASLPLLISLILMKNNPSFSYIINNMYKQMFSMFFILAFLAKMPMFFLHLWLPKAHVEAPLEGSMILAAVLLKLGGYGLIRIIPLLMNNMNFINPLMISISMVGATMTSLNCMRQKDLKSLIAYSSVAHMGFVLASIFSISYIGKMGAILMMFAHGLSSSALFTLVNDLYYKYHTRNISLFKGMISIMPNITFWWFMFMAVNISAPPTINTISEIFIMSSLILWNKNIMLLIFMASLGAASFSMLMFINISHNKSISMPTSNTNSKLYMSMLLHLLPLPMLLFKLNIIN